MGQRRGHLLLHFRLLLSGKSTVATLPPALHASGLQQVYVMEHVTRTVFAAIPVFESTGQTL